MKIKLISFFIIILFGLTIIGTPTEVKAYEACTYVTNVTQWSPCYYDGTGYKKYAQAIATTTTSASIKALVVGGGGGVGGGVSNVAYHGGGGGGQVISTSSYAVDNISYPITVGSGGIINNNGTNSIFGVITALMGQTGTTTGKGGTSGSNFLGGSPRDTSGNAGTGGGGNAGAGSINTRNTGGAGGSGTANSISGTSTVYGKGGQGGDINGTIVAPNNTGQGGGGTSGIGGSGVVIVRYPTINFGNSIGGIKTVLGLDTIHTFNSSGTMTFTNPICANLSVPVVEACSPPANNTCYDGTNNSIVDHGNADWIISSDTNVAGKHINVSTFRVNTGVTATVLPFDGLKCGLLEVHAKDVVVNGTINANGSGYGGGGGGGGLPGSGYLYSSSNASGSMGSAGSGVAGGANGFASWYENTATEKGHTGPGGVGGGSCGGTGGSSKTVDRNEGVSSDGYCDSNDTATIWQGGDGSFGVYYCTALPDTDDKNIWMGSGGGGGAGGTGSYIEWLCNANAGGGGGGAGGKGGGAIKLFADNKILVTGNINSKVLINGGNGRGGGGAERVCDSHGDGGSGGNAASAGTVSAPGAGGSCDSYAVFNSYTANCNPSTNYCFAGANGGGGAGGAGGGILLNATNNATSTVIITGSVNNYGSGDDANAGTLKVFSCATSTITGALSYGRLYSAVDPACPNVVSSNDGAPIVDFYARTVTPPYVATTTVSSGGSLDLIWTAVNPEVVKAKSNSWFASIFLADAPDLGDITCTASMPNNIGSAEWLGNKVASSTPQVDPKINIITNKNYQLSCSNNIGTTTKNVIITLEGSTGETCSDGILNNEETEIDCGGPNCPACTGLTNPPDIYCGSATSTSSQTVPTENLCGSGFSLATGPFETTRSTPNDSWYWTCTDGMPRYSECYSTKTNNLTLNHDYDSTLEITNPSGNPDIVAINTQITFTSFAKDSKYNSNERQWQVNDTILSSSENGSILSKFFTTLGPKTVTATILSGDEYYGNSPMKSFEVVQGDDQRLRER